MLGSRVSLKRSWGEVALGGGGGGGGGGEEAPLLSDTLLQSKRTSERQQRRDRPALEKPHQLPPTPTNSTFVLPPTRRRDVEAGRDPQGNVCTPKARFFFRLLDDVTSKQDHFCAEGTAGGEAQQTGTKEFTLKLLFLLI